MTDPEPLAVTLGRTEKPLLHVQRHRFPWRKQEVGKTECGHLVAEFTHVISHEELGALIKEYGQQRAAMLVCMTCWNRWENPRQSWDADPLAVMEREVNVERWQHRGDSLLRQELRAIAALIAAHPEEFADLLHGLEEMVTPEQLAAKRAEKRYRQAVHRSRL